jgi:hypothetical protein
VLVTAQTAVDQTVDHAVPVDPMSPVLLALVLLELSTEEVPVTGIERGQPSAPGHHFLS